MTVYKGR